MAGKRKGRGGTVNVTKSSKQVNRNNGRRNDSAELNEASAQSRAPRPVIRNPARNNNSNQPPRQISTRGAATIYEDDAIVHISAEGQDTEYDDGASQTDSMESEPEDRNQFSGTPRGLNNNATVAANARPRSQLEDGECEDMEESNATGPSAKRSRVQPSTSRPIAMSGEPQDLRSYVDEKFSALTKMVELERELSEKNRELDLLRAKGIHMLSIEEENKGGPACVREPLVEPQNSTRSEITIYKNAVQQAKRDSSSSEEIIDTSNELEIETLEENREPTEKYDNYDNYYDYHISEREIEKAKEIERKRRRDDRSGFRGNEERYFQGDDQRDYREDRNFSRDSDYRANQVALTPRRDFVGEKAKKLINEAESAKARIYEVPGKDNSFEFDDNYEMQLKNYRKSVTTLEMDEDYQMVAAHVDGRLRSMIVNHSYIDLAKLLPRNRLGSFDEDAQTLQLVNRGGAAGFVSLSEKAGVINNYAKWEQAFRIFSDIYTNSYPSRATELIQYNHTIHTASQSYIWENVYLYDIEVRKHMETHPSRNWGIILNMACVMCIKDRHYGHNGYNGQGRNQGKNGGKPSPSDMKQRKACFDFNAGKCTYGNKCKYDHRCGLCAKYGHGTQSCRRMTSPLETKTQMKKEN